MDSSGRLRWLPAVILVGVVYLVAGITFAALANRAASNQMRVTWRLAAWVISAATFAAHIWYEHVRLLSSPGTTASHVSLAVALGAFALAVAANVHAQAAAPPRRLSAGAISSSSWNACRIGCMTACSSIAS